MASILLNETDGFRRARLRANLEQQGHKVWYAMHLNDIVATLLEVPVDLVIFDVDQQRMDDLAAFANRWRGVKVLFQLSTGEPLYDFRSWMADNFVFKHRAIDNVASAVNQLLNN